MKRLLDLLVLVAVAAVLAFVYEASVVVAPADAAAPPRVKGLPAPPPITKEMVAMANRLVDTVFDEQIQVWRVEGRLGYIEKSSGEKLPRHYKNKVTADFRKQIPALKTRTREMYLKIYTEEELKTLGQFNELYPGLLKKVDAAMYRSVIYMMEACNDINVQLGREQEWNR